MDSQRQRAERLHLMSMHYNAECRSVGIAYVLLILCGFLGAHRFYLGQSEKAVLCIFLFLISLLLIFPYGLSFLYDLVTLAGSVRGFNSNLERELRRKFGL